MRARRFENILKLLSKRGMQWSASSMWKKKSALTSACVVNTVEVSDVRVDRNKKTYYDALKAKCFQLMGGWWKFMLTAYKCLQKFFFFKYYFKQVGLELILMESIKLLTHIYGLILQNPHKQSLKTLAKNNNSTFSRGDRIKIKLSIFLHST